MKIETENIRSYRLKAHHLEKKLPLSGLADAAGACGVQNSPPGAWETAMFNRLEGCSLPILHDALYEKKILLRHGVSAVFLSFSDRPKRRLPDGAACPGGRTAMDLHAWYHSRSGLHADVFR